MAAYANIRQILGAAVGLKILDITQHDAEDYKHDGTSFIMLMLEDGHYIKFHSCADGFEHNLPKPVRQPKT